jgi:hypothetical protein
MKQAFKPDACGIFNPLKQIEGWSDVAAEESELRNDAMLGLPEDICGFKVKPLTYRHILWLTIYQNIFLASYTPDELMSFPEIHLHIARFIWVLSIGFKPFDTAEKDLFFEQYNKRATQIDTKKIITEILKFMDDSTFDLRISESSDLTASYCSPCASVVNALCSVYSGISPLPDAPNSALDLPLKIAGQLLRAHIKSNNPKTHFKNRTDVLEQQWLTDLNRELLKGNG